MRKYPGSIPSEWRSVVFRLRPGRAECNRMLLRLDQYFGEPSACVLLGVPVLTYRGWVIGVKPGDSFGLFGTYISGTGYRSVEAIAGNEVGLDGWNPAVQTSFATYTTVPEPSTVALLGLAGLVLLVRRLRWL